MARRAAGRRPKQEAVASQACWEDARLAVAWQEEGSCSAGL